MVHGVNSLVGFRKRGLGRRPGKWTGHGTEQEIGRELSEDQIHLAGSTYIHTYIHTCASSVLASESSSRDKGHSLPFFRFVAFSLFVGSFVMDCGSSRQGALERGLGTPAQVASASCLLGVGNTLFRQHKCQAAFVLGGGGGAPNPKQVAARNFLLLVCMKRPGKRSSTSMLSIETSVMNPITSPRPISLKFPSPPHTKK